MKFIPSRRHKTKKLIAKIWICIALLLIAIASVFLFSEKVHKIGMVENIKNGNVIRTNGSDNILLTTAQGMAICFNETDVRPMGRDAAGVRGISLSQGDVVVGAEKAEEGKTLLTVTENGYGKRTELSEYLRTGPDGEKVPQSRGGKGLKNYSLTAKTGLVSSKCSRDRHLAMVLAGAFAEAYYGDASIDTNYIAICNQLLGHSE